MAVAKFDQVWYWQDEAMETVYGIYEFDDYLEVRGFTYHGFNDMAYYEAFWSECRLPSDAIEFWAMQERNDCEGFSVRGTEREIFMEVDEGVDAILKELIRIFNNVQPKYDEWIDNPIEDITCHVYEEEENMFDKIKELNKSVDKYIAEVEKQISEIEDQKRVEQEASYAKVKDFLDKRLAIAREMGTQISVYTEDGYKILFNYNFANEIHFIVPREGRPDVWEKYCVLRHSYHDTFKSPSQSTLAKPDFDKFICNLDYIQATLFDEEFYKACTEILTKKVNDAREKLENARK